jgi:hypothetical protein
MPNNTDIRRPQPIFLNLSPTIDGMEDLSDYAMTTHTRKNLSTNAGTWEVTLAPSPYAKERISRADFQNIVYQSIRPMDCVIIGQWGQGFNNDDQYSKQHFMFGFIDNVYRSYSSVNGRVERSVNVRGRDATKLFAMDNIALAPELATNPDLKDAFINTKVLEFLQMLRGTVNGKNIFVNSWLPQAIYWILQNAPSMRIGLDYLQGKTSIKGDPKSIMSPADLFQTYLMARADEKIYDIPMTMYSGSLLNYFTSLIDPAFYEIWVDTIPYNSPSNITGTTRPCLIVRPKPYDYSWEKTNSKGEDLQNVFLETDINDPLTSIKMWSDKDNGNYNWQNFIHPIAGSSFTINDEDIMRSNLGISDEEIFTMFRVNGKGDIIGTGPLSTFGLNFPLIDAMNMKTYGMRELSIESGLIPPSVDDLSQRYNAKLGIKIDREQREEYARLWDSAILSSSAAKRNYIMPLNSNSNQADFIKLLTFISGNNKPELQNNALLRLVTTEKRDRLWRWNRYNHLLESGMLTMKGRNVFVGQKLISNDNTNLFWTRGLFNPQNRTRNSKKGMEFYCVGVDQSGGWGRTWETTLSLTRGANMSELETYYNQRGLGRAAGSINQIFARNTEGEMSAKEME